MDSTLQLRRMEPRLKVWPSASTSSATISKDPALDEKLERLEQLASIGALSTGLAHEIKNAMVAVRTFVEMLLADHKSAELAGIVQREVLRIDALLSQMLRCASQPKRRLARVPLHEILERSLRLIEPQLRAQNIRLNRNFLAARDALQGDAHQLEQAFLNLLINACDAIGCDGEIRVETSIVSSRVAGRKQATNLLQVRIQDTGKGMTPEELARMFEPFYTTKSHGTGLGLPITRGIFEEHRGSISARSQLNKGTTFQVALPLA